MRYALFFLILIGAGSGVYYFVRRWRTKRDISRSLNLVLFSILMPQDASKEAREGKEDTKKDIISVMEQLYTGMGRSTAPFAFEIALPSVGEETTFYAAVPRKIAGVFEKQTHALFPRAKVERTNDYNMFNEEGATSGSVLTLKRSAFFPIRTYRHLEVDPLEVIATAFSKLKKEGEGAAMQLALRAAGSEWQKKGREAVRFLRQGKTPEEFEKGGRFKGEAAGFARELMRGPQRKKGEEKSERPPAIDEALVTLLEDKATKTGFEVNIRLLASAGTKEEADAILEALEDAYLQFAEPQANSFVVRRLEGKALQEMIYAFSFRLFAGERAIYLAASELTSLYHFPVGSLSAPKVKFLKAREAPPPANLPQEGVVFGENVFRGETAVVRLMRDDRRRHLYIIGQTGTGKTNFMKRLIHQDITNGEGVCFIDPHGETVEEILSLIPKERVEDVIYFNPGDTARPLGLNMLEYDVRFPEQKTFVVNELFNIFQKLYGAIPESMGPMFEQYFRNATLLVMDDPASGNTLLDVERLLVDKEYRAHKLSRSNNIVVRTFWQDVAEKAGGEASLQNIVPYITSKFDIFLANEIMRPIVAQEHSAFNFRAVLDQQKILLVNLSKGRLGDINAALLGLILVGKLLMAAFSRVSEPEKARKDFYLYIDEFQNVTTDSIATILSEARKYRLNLILAHQFIGQLEEKIKKAVFGNVGSLAAFRIGADDAEFIEQQFEPVFNAHDLMNIDNYHAYLKLLIRGQTSRPFNIRTLPADTGNPAVAEAVKELSSMKYGRPRDEVEMEIARRHAAKPQG